MEQPLELEEIASTSSKSISPFFESSLELLAEDLEGELLDVS